MAAHRHRQAFGDRRLRLYVALLAVGLHVNVAKTISFIAGTTTVRCTP